MFGKVHQLVNNLLINSFYSKCTNGRQVCSDVCFSTKINTTSSTFFNVNIKTSTSNPYEKDENNLGEDIIIVNPLASPPTQCESQE